MSLIRAAQTNALNFPGKAIKGRYTGDTAMEVKIGQIWQENDRRFPDAPLRRVLKFLDDSVMLENTTGKSVGRRAFVSIARMNGKLGGYRLIQEVEQ